MKGVGYVSNSRLLDAMIAQSKLSKKQTEKQQKIVETAIKLFAEKGYANTSTSEIAKAAGVAEGTIFRHYGTKDNLLLSVILPFFKDSLPMMAEEVFKEVMSEKDTTFDEFLKALLKNRIEFFSANKEIFQVVIKEILYNEELKNELLPFLSENILPRLKSAVEHYQKQGELKNIPSSQIVKMIITFFGGFIVSRFVLLNVDKISDLEIDHIVNFVLDGINK
ncbi:TetR family transcriptional regulator [Bacillus sp. AFS040349]|nr:TetR family transcriptional regulator [Bacillus sp. AFS040349]